MQRLQLREAEHFSWNFTQLVCADLHPQQIAAK
jgi:hypothetical protein